MVVERLMDVERYSHVMHISSTVRGRLARHLDAWDALRAALPAGTVSGAPKVICFHFHTPSLPLSCPGFSCATHPLPRNAWGLNALLKVHLAARAACWLTCQQ